MDPGAGRTVDRLLRIIQDAIGRYEYRISQRPRLAFSAGGIGKLPRSGNWLVS